MAFIPFIMAGDPDLDTTEQALRILDQEGADVIELGVPYSVRWTWYMLGSVPVGLGTCWAEYLLGWVPVRLGTCWARYLLGSVPVGFGMC